MVNGIDPNTIRRWDLSSIEYQTWVNSRAFVSGSRVNIAGLPDLLIVYAIPAHKQTIFILEQTNKKKTSLIEI